MKSKIAVYVAGALISLAASHSANAALMVSLSGVAGTGETTITLSGSSVVESGGGSFIIGTTDTGSWFSFGDYVSSTFNNVVLGTTGGSASVAVNGISRSINGAYVDDDTDLLDDFGFRVAGSDLAFATGDTISWSGTFTIGADFAEFNPGSYSTNDFGFGRAAAQIDMTVGASAVPLPTSLALVGLSLVGFAFTGRRKA